MTATEIDRYTYKARPRSEAARRKLLQADRPPTVSEVGSIRVPHSMNGKRFPGPGTAMFVRWGNCASGLTTTYTEGTGEVGTSPMWCGTWHCDVCMWWRVERDEGDADTGRPPAWRLQYELMPDLLDLPDTGAPVVYWRATPDDWHPRMKDRMKEARKRARKAGETFFYLRASTWTYDGGKLHHYLSSHDLPGVADPEPGRRLLPEDARSFLLDVLLRPLPGWIAGKPSTCHKPWKLAVKPKRPPSLVDRRGDAGAGRRAATQLGKWVKDYRYTQGSPPPLDAARDEYVWIAAATD